MYFLTNDNPLWKVPFKFHYAGTYIVTVGDFVFLMKFLHPRQDNPFVRFPNY